jgi:hypothetical protein
VGFLDRDGNDQDIRIDCVNMARELQVVYGVVQLQVGHDNVCHSSVSAPFCP